MLLPKKAKYRKQFRGVIKGFSSRGGEIAFGEYALMAVSSGWVTSRQLEAARKAITHFTQRGGRIWIRIFPDKPVSKKPPETRMGGGKGDVVGYVAVVRPGRIIFEIGGIERKTAEEALRLASYKLPVKTNFLIKKGYETE